jgi:hypothetical protein
MVCNEAGEHEFEELDLDKQIYILETIGNQSKELE